MLAHNKDLHDFPDFTAVAGKSRNHSLELCASIVTAEDSEDTLPYRNWLPKKASSKDRKITMKKIGNARVRADAVLLGNFRLGCARKDNR